MILKKRITQIMHTSGVETTLEVLVYDNLIQWNRSERMQFYEGEFWTEEQSIMEYLQKGPPDLLHDLSQDKKDEIEMLIRLMDNKKVELDK